MHERWTKLFLTMAVALFAVVVGLPWLSEVRGDDAAVKRKMNQWKAELGVKCDHCHVLKDKKFDYKAKTPRKDIAAHCEENFVKKLEAPGGKKISCVDCHHNKPRFLPRPANELPPPVAGGGGDEGEKDKDGK